MELTSYSLWTMLHGMVFGALFLLAGSGALVALRGRYVGGGQEQVDSGSRFLRDYLGMMAVAAWAAVLSGAYIIYPWYRAKPPAGTTNLAGFPQRLLQSAATTAGWHSIGMEWKEHVAWLAPIAITMAWAVVKRYGTGLRAQRGLREAVLGFVALSMVAAGIAGFLGAMLNKTAPVTGGGRIVIEGEK